jgi:hypothetical protein
MPGPNDPYEYSDNPFSAKHPFWQSIRTAANSPTASTVGQVIGTALLPGPTLFFNNGGFSNVPGLDFVLNPDRYPKNASLLNPTGWNTAITRREKEQAGVWKNVPYQFAKGDDPVSISSQYGITTQQLLEANPGGYPFNIGQTLNVPQQTQTPQPAQAAQPAPANNSDYANTRAAQEYAKNGTPFLDQMRWDPQRKKYVSLGRLIKQGKLDIRGNWRKSTNRQRQGQGNRPQQQAEQKQDYTLANSFITFGVGSG